MSVSWPCNERAAPFLITDLRLFITPARVATRQEGLSPISLEKMRVKWL